MKILILTSFDSMGSRIGSRRPYMFAYWLKQFGHDVTVISSGISGDMPCVSRDIRAVKKDIFHILYRRFENRYKRVKQAVDEICQSVTRYRLVADKVNRLDSRDPFDVVFSTYGYLEMLFSGWYASRKLKCRWIMDFRDPLLQWKSKPWFRNTFLYLPGKLLLKKADLVTSVSIGFSRSIGLSLGVAVKTLFNGYDGRSTDIGVSSGGNGKLTICYTGSVCTGDREEEAFKSFIKMLHSLCQAGVCTSDNIRFICAGHKTEILCRMLSESGYSEIVDYRGIVSPEESLVIQGESDLLLILSWNTTEEQGVIPAKLYDSVISRKQVLCFVHGEVPNSELWSMNELYHFGFCFEDSQSDGQFEKLCAFFSNVYSEKRERGVVSYQPPGVFIKHFDYHNLALQLEQLMIDVCFVRE